MELTSINQMVGGSFKITTDLVGIDKHDTASRIHNSVHQSLCMMFVTSMLRFAEETTYNLDGLSTSQQIDAFSNGPISLKVSVELTLTAAGQEELLTHELNVAFEALGNMPDQIQQMLDAETVRGKIKAFTAKVRERFSQSNPDKHDIRQLMDELALSADDLELLDTPGIIDVVVVMGHHPGCGHEVDDSLREEDEDGATKGDPTDNRGHAPWDVPDTPTSDRPMADSTTGATR